MPTIKFLSMEKRFLAIGNAPHNRLFERDHVGVRTLNPVSHREVLDEFLSGAYVLAISFNIRYILDGYGNELYKRGIPNIIPTVEVFNLARPAESKAFLIRNDIPTTKAEIFDNLDDIYDFLEYTDEYPFIIRTEKGSRLVKNSSQAAHALKVLVDNSTVFPQIIVENISEDKLEREISFAFGNKIIGDGNLIRAIRSDVGHFDGFVESVKEGDRIVYFKFIPSEEVLGRFLDDNWKEFMEAIS